MLEEVHAALFIGAALLKAPMVRVVVTQMSCVGRVFVHNVSGILRQI